MKTLHDCGYGTMLNVVFEQTSLGDNLIRGLMLPCIAKCRLELAPNAACAFGVPFSAVVMGRACPRNVTSALDISDCGPRAAVRRLDCHLVATNAKVWMERARLQSI